MEWEDWLCVVGWFALSLMRAARELVRELPWFVAAVWAVVLLTTCRGFYEENPGERWLAGILLVVGVLVGARLVVGRRTGGEDVQEAGDAGTLSEDGRGGR